MQGVRHISAVQKQYWRFSRSFHSFKEKQYWRFLDVEDARILPVCLDNLFINYKKIHANVQRFIRKKEGHKAPNDNIMNIVSLNIRGCGNKAKHRRIYQFLITCKVDFLQNLNFQQ